ncbi:MAG TPA: hypothetical protein VHP58_05665 [Alphaproteobacteria bacterium]|nr:hypothetical protein [Alphaproteobacteria bacterium]
MPSRTPYTDLLHTQGVLITRHPLPEDEDAHPFSNSEADDLESEVAEREDEEVLMPTEQIEEVLYLNKDDIADSDESQEWQVEQTKRGVNAG